MQIIIKNENLLSTILQARKCTQKLIEDWDLNYHQDIKRK